MRQALQDRELRDLFQEAGRAEAAPSVQGTLAAVRRRAAIPSRNRWIFAAAALSAAALFFWLVLPGLLEDSSSPGEPVADLSPVPLKQTEDSPPAPPDFPEEGSRVRAGGDGSQSASRPTKSQAAIDLENCLAAKEEGDVDKAMELCALVPAGSEEGKAALAEINAVKEAYKAKHQKSALLALSRGDEKGLKEAAREIALLEKYIGRSDTEVAALASLYKTLQSATQAKENTTSAPLNPAKSRVSSKDLVEEATALAAMRKYKEALLRLDEAQKIAPGDPDVYRTQAAIHNAVGNIDKACIAFRRYLRLAPQGSYAKQARTYINVQDSSIYPNCKL